MCTAMIILKGIFEKTWTSIIKASCLNVSNLLLWTNFFSPATFFLVGKDVARFLFSRGGKVELFKDKKLSS